MKVINRKSLVVVFLIVLVALIVLINTAYIYLANGMIAFLLILSYFTYKRLQQSEVKETKYSKVISKLNDEVDCLKRENKKLINIHDYIGVVAFSFNFETNESYVSKAIERFSNNRKREEIINPTIFVESLCLLDKEKTSTLHAQFTSDVKTTKEYRIKDQNEDVRWIEIEVTPLCNGDGNVRLITGMLTDVTNRKNLELQLNQMAYYDDLTDLPNRNLIRRHIIKTLSRSKRHNYSFAVMFIDLDGFKKVNDTLGHESGDLLLIEVANRLNDIVREEDLTGRLGGDEFIIVFEEIQKEEVEKITERILEVISQPYVIRENEVNISPSIGISLFPEHGEDIETLIKNADKAMYHAKDKGKNCYQFYDSNLENGQERTLKIFEKIMETVNNNDFIQAIKNKW